MEDRHYEEELAFARTEDGLTLEGAIIRPAEAVAPMGTVVWIHGGAMSFCAPPYIDLGRELARRGVIFVTGNTRGHDGVALLWNGERIIAGGAGWERHDEANRDLAPWVTRAAEQGSAAVILAGHSLGACKVVHYQATVQDARVAAVIVAAPPVVGIPSHPERLALARRMLEEGRGEELLPHLEGTPPWNVISAQALATRENLIRSAFSSELAPATVSKVRCPLLALYGTSEQGTTEALETIRTNAGGPCETQMIQNADHDFSGRAREVARTIVNWMRSL